MKPSGPRVETTQIDARIVGDGRLQDEANIVTDCGPDLAKWSIVGAIDGLDDGFGESTSGPVERFAEAVGPIYEVWASPSPAIP